jgi:hypothetical protein
MWRGRNGKRTKRQGNETARGRNDQDETARGRNDQDETARGRNNRDETTGTKRQGEETTSYRSRYVVQIKPWTFLTIKLTIRITRCTTKIVYFTKVTFHSGHSLSIFKTYRSFRSPIKCTQASQDYQLKCIKTTDKTHFISFYHFCWYIMHQSK